MDIEKTLSVLENVIGYELALLNGDETLAGAANKNDHVVKQSRVTKKQLDKIMKRVEEHLKELV